MTSLTIVIDVIIVETDSSDDISVSGNRSIVSENKATSTLGTSVRLHNRNDYSTSHKLKAHRSMYVQAPELFDQSPHTTQRFLRAQLQPFSFNFFQNQNPDAAVWVNNSIKNGSLQVSLDLSAVVAQTEWGALRDPSGSYGVPRWYLSTKETDVQIFITVCHFCRQFHRHLFQNCAHSWRTLFWIYTARKTSTCCISTKNSRDLVYLCKDGG